MKNKPVILVVDDQPQNIELLEAFLIKQDYTIIQAGSGEEALGKLSSNQVDLVLLDAIMPGMSGFDVLTEIRVNIKTLRIPVVIITAYNENEARLKAFESGCDDFISKPFDRYELLARVKSLLRIKFLNDEIDEAREFAENVINTVREPLISLDHDLRVVTASRSFYEFFMVKPEETVGQLIYDLGNKQWDIPKLRELLETILPQKTTFDNYEVEHKFATIGRRIMLLNARQIQRAFGSERIILLAIEDITERKQLEDLLKDSEMRYRRIYETASDGIVLLEKSEGHIIHANPAAEKMLGYSKEEYVGKMLQDIGVPLDMSDFPSIMQALDKSGIINYDNIEVIPKAGNSINADIYMVDKSLLAQCNIRDVTERKQAESYRDMEREVLQTLNEPEIFQDSIQNVLETLKTHMLFDAVAISLQDGDDVPYFAQIGFSRDFVLGENPIIDYTDNGNAFQDKDVCTTMQCACGLDISGKTDPKHPLYTPGGTFWTNDSPVALDILTEADPQQHPRNACIHQCYASFALVPIQNKDRIVGQIQFYDRDKGRFSRDLVEILEGIATDIGAALLRKKAEAEKFKLETQLLQAQKMESIGLLAGGVAHDFNNMLSIIVRYAQLGLMGLDPSNKLHAYLTEISNAADRSADLTRQLLAFARKQTIAPKVLNLNETVTSMFKMLQRLIGENIQLNWEPGANLLAVNMDPSQIDQILANMCVNAQNAISGVGTITIKTRNECLDEDYCSQHVGFVPGEYVLLTISDDGCGMDKETLAHIFEPFFTTKGVGEGTGLGLATVYGIVKQNNGFINAYSEPGSGTIFTIYLPRHVGTSDQVKAETSAVLAPHGTETILLVEDEPHILTVTTIILEKLGYTVLPANSPTEAFNQIKDHASEIQLLMTDVVMPEMNGRDLAKHLMSLYPQLKCLFTSGYTANVIAHNGVLDEGLHFIHKPFSLFGIATKLREVLDS